ncbi:Serine/threonine kinase [Coemansia thaxteri]|uniref:protein kinase C n=1 Tax=Coemansia thaxteri TaxID=2663907 RepID=A0A9W8BJQ0_9FUNG|nr:Serine/threonine kinase [Coemansia thaxteri]KAJ2482844.1 Serine/threonine kinase [Coemansia sp. RSA 2320]
MQTSSIDLESAISKVREKLDKERVMLEKTRQLATQIRNPSAKVNATAMIVEAEQRVTYLEAEFRRLSQKREDRNSIRSSGGNSYNADPSSPTGTTSDRGSVSISKLDLRKTSSHLSAQKISLKVHEIAYKLEVERKIRDKANSIRMLYSNDHHRGSKDKITQITDPDHILHESNDRIRLLDYSLKMYQSLNVEYADEDDDTLNGEGPESVAVGAFQLTSRRPITGKLQLRIHRAKNLRRAPIYTKAFRTPHQFIVVKIDGRVCGTTPIVHDSTFNYYFEIDVKKASEVELSIFERGDKDYLTGLMWIRLSEIYEEIRKKEIIAESSSGWATAEQMAKDAPSSSSGYGSHSPSITSLGHQSSTGSHHHPPSSSGSRPGAPNASPGVLSEWDVESQGQIELWMNFTKDTTKRRQQSRLGRKAAVRKRKGPCTEMCGHHFYPLHTYSIMKCAICNDHIVNEIGQQCDDCQLFVHQKCVGRVVSHCHFNQGGEETLELGHRIPHRWEMSTNIGANWCCHCGNMLPIGRRAIKCTECSLTCHSGCKANVPNLCGLDMMKASAMINEIKRAKGSAVPQPKVLTKRDTVAKKPGQSPGNAASAVSADSADVAAIQNRLEQMQPPTIAAQKQQHLSSIPARLSQGATGHQRTNSNEFVPIKSGSPTSPTPPHQMQPRPQATSGYPQSGVQPPSYYQQQFQQAKNTYATQSPPPSQQQQIQPGQQYAQYRPQQQQQSPYQQQQQPYQQQPYLQQQPYKQQQPYQQQQQQQPPYQQQQMAYGRQSMYGAASTGAPVHSPSQPIGVAGQPLAPAINQDLKQQIYQAMTSPPQIASAISSATQPQHPQPQQPRQVGISDFTFIKVLGKGNFGKVMLSEEKSSAKLYAIKVLKKEFIVENDEFDSTRSEKRMLLIANKERHPFLIGLHSCFQTSNHIFFVMEYISGGDLMMHVQKLGSFGERRAKFFACEILLGLSYFHKMEIVYRDLKLDNIILDKDGHVKIADYGLCKENMGYGQTTITFCGTPEFMAPEIVLEQRYGRAVDWWAFGVLIYEMILGTSPFHGEDENEIFDSILEDEILYPVRMSRDSVFICQALLEKDPSKRLGSGPSDGDDIMKHSFFTGINWDDVLNKRIPPPYVPEIRGRLDVSNFDPEFTNEKPGLTPTNTIIDARDQKEFNDFDYVSPWAGSAEKWTR